MKAHAVLMMGLLLATALSGCFGGQKQQEQAPPPPPPELSRAELARLEQLAAPEIRNYTLPGSAKLEPQVEWFNGSIDQSANAAYQDRNMRGGNDFNTALTTYDISALVPVGQPTALRMTLVYYGKPGSAAMAHIYVCVPGTCTSYSTDNNDQFNWKATVVVQNVVTVGVSGAKHEVGVVAANGLVLTEELDFALSVEATYFADVLTPANAYAFKVPQGATGITMRSVKPGQEHLQAKFVILDPQDELVAYNEYDDIAIVSESIFVPIRQPGEYVFYAQEMHNGFFTIVSDAPLGNDTALRVLPVSKVEASLGSGPAPGVPERDVVGGACVDIAGCTGPPSAPTPYTEGTKAAFTTDKGFPLELGATLKPGVVGAVEVRISSAKGLVYKFQRVARVDTDTQGSLGYTRDEANTMVDWSKLADGPHSVSLVYDGGNAELSYWYKTFQR